MNIAKVAQSHRVSNRVGNSLFGFSCESLVFDKKERIALSIFLKESKLLLSLFLKEREEQIALHCYLKEREEQIALNCYLKEREEQIALHCYLKEHINIVHSNWYDTKKEQSPLSLHTKSDRWEKTRKSKLLTLVPKIRKTVFYIFFMSRIYDLSLPHKI